MFTNDLLTSCCFFSSFHRQKSERHNNNNNNNNSANNQTQTTLNDQNNNNNIQTKNRMQEPSYQQQPPSAMPPPPPAQLDLPNAYTTTSVSAPSTPGDQPISSYASAESSPNSTPNMTPSASVSSFVLTNALGLNNSDQAPPTTTTLGQHEQHEQSDLIKRASELIIGHDIDVSTSEDTKLDLGEKAANNNSHLLDEEAGSLTPTNHHHQQQLIVTEQPHHEQQQQQQQHEQRHNADDDSEEFQLSVTRGECISAIVERVVKISLEEHEREQKEKAAKESPTPTTTTTTSQPSASPTTMSLIEQMLSKHYASPKRSASPMTTSHVLSSPPSLSSEPAASTQNPFKLLLNAELSPKPSTPTLTAHSTLSPTGTTIHDAVAIFNAANKERELVKIAAATKAALELAAQHTPAALLPQPSLIIEQQQQQQHNEPTQQPSSPIAHQTAPNNTPVVSAASPSHITHTPHPYPTTTRQQQEPTVVPPASSRQFCIDLNMKIAAASAVIAKPTQQQQQQQDTEVPPTAQLLTTPTLPLASHHQQQHQLDRSSVALAPPQPLPASRSDSTRFTSNASTSSIHNDLKKILEGNSSPHAANGNAAVSTNNKQHHHDKSIYKWHKAQMQTQASALEQCVASDAKPIVAAAGKCQLLKWKCKRKDTITAILKFDNNRRRVECGSEQSALGHRPPHDSAQPEQHDESEADARAAASTAVVVVVVCVRRRAVDECREQTDPHHHHSQ